MDLKDRLDAAIGSPPPTAMDPDALIAAGRTGERTRRRWQGATAAGILALAGGSVALVPESGPVDGPVASSSGPVFSTKMPCPNRDESASPSPRPTVAPALPEAAVRQALEDVLDGLAPGAAARIEILSLADSDYERCGIVPPGSLSALVVTVRMTGWAPIQLVATRRDGSVEERAARATRTGDGPYYAHWDDAVPDGQRERRTLPGGVQGVVYPVTGDSPYPYVDAFGPDGLGISAYQYKERPDTGFIPSPGVGVGDGRVPTADELLRIAGALALLTR